METQKIKIAIVVLNWNGKSWLEKFLPILLEYSQDKAKVFVADNASDDDSVDFVKEKYPNAEIIINTNNGGYAKGYNDALKNINAEYFVLINSDIEVTKDWLSPLVNLMDNNKNVVACHPKVLSYNNKQMFEYAGASGGFIDNLGYPFCRGRVFDKIEKDIGQYNDSIEIFWATGACFIVRSVSFWEVGGFDEDFFAHQEEIDLCWRFKNKGYIIMVEPKSVVYHVGGGTLSVTSPLKTYLNFRNNLSMLFKNLPLFYLFIVIPLRLFLDGIAAFFLLRQEKGVRHFLAVIKAHFSFYFKIPKLIGKRQKIQQKYHLTGKIKRSILWKYKISH